MSITLFEVCFGGHTFRGETIRVHHDTIHITIQSSRYDTYRDMLYTCTCTAVKEHTNFWVSNFAT